MIVDDDLDIATVLPMVLRKSGFQIAAYTNPRKALSDYRPSDYDLVLLDVRMPGMSGYDLYRGLRALHSGIKVLFLTAIDVQDEIVKLFPELAAEWVMQKAVQIKLLVETIQKRIASPPCKFNAIVS